MSRAVRAFVRGRAAALLLVLAAFFVAGPLQADPFSRSVPCPVLSGAVFAGNAMSMSDLTQNDAVIGVTRQIEAIRRMPGLTPVRVLMRSDTTHMGLEAKNVENMAVSAVKMPPMVRLIAGGAGECACIAVRAPPTALL